MTIVFLAITALLIIIEYRINRRAVNVVSLLIIPYMFIVLGNRLWGEKLGYIAISDNVLIMLLSAFICYFLGSLFANLGSKEAKGTAQISKAEINDLLSAYRIREMRNYIFFVETIVLIRLALIVNGRGLSYLSTNAFEGKMLSGPLGHLFLTIYPLIPVIFLYWLNNKKKWSFLLAAVLGFSLYFTTFVKYHVIGLLVSTYLLAAFEDKKYLKKGAILLVIIVSAVFIGNYFLTFLFRGTAANVTASYYFGRLWAYISGSLIYDNRIFTARLRANTTILYKLGTFICALPNMFLNALWGIRLFPHIALPHIILATNGQTGNVVDAIGYLFPSNGSAFDYILFGIVLLMIGFIFTCIFNCSIKKNSLHLTLTFFLTFFTFFSFFGTFYINAMPWEILIWSFVMQKLFKRKAETDTRISPKLIRR